MRRIITITLVVVLGPYLTALAFADSATKEEVIAKVNVLYLNSYTSIQEVFHGETPQILYASLLTEFP